MKMTFRHYGPGDPVTLEQISQIPVIRSIVSAVYDVPAGGVWSHESIDAVKTAAAAHNLAFEVVESVPVPEEIKLGAPEATKLIDNYCENVRRLGQAGVKCICYNFMPVFDWLRSEMEHQSPDGSNSLAYDEQSVEALRIKAAADFGVLLIDGLVDGLWLENPSSSAEELNSIMFGILQATRARISKTEYIACPGCGRTMYDLQGTLARIKAATAHLKGLKIGVMGCIVNGPGEMADADYGYVGAARGKVSLYRRKECVEKNIPEEEAIERLLQLIESDKNK
jgi:D-mannonate dehydratase